MIVRVDAEDDPRLEDFRDVRDAARHAGGHFLAEGLLLLEALVAHRARHPIRAVLASERMAERAAALVAPAPEVTLFVAPTALVESLVGFPMHRGVLASALRPTPREAAPILTAARTVIVLEGLCNADNVGGIFRTAAALGADALLLDEASCDPLYRKALRVSMGAVLALPWARVPSAAAALTGLGAAGFCTVALSPGGHADLRELPPPERLALALGTEGPGLSAAALAACTVRAAIPMRAGIDSLNVTTAAAVALWALARPAPIVFGGSEAPPASASPRLGLPPHRRR